MQLACMNSIEDLAGRPCCRGGMQPKRITKRMSAPGRGICITFRPTPCRMTIDHERPTPAKHWAPAERPLNPPDNKAAPVRRPGPLGSLGTGRWVIRWSRPPRTP